MLRSRRHATATDESFSVRNNCPRPRPVSESDIEAIQRLARELQLFAGELRSARADDLIRLVHPSVEAIPNAAAPLATWMIRALLVNVLQRIDAQFGPPAHPHASALEALWRADSSARVRDIFQKHVNEVAESPATAPRGPTKSCGDSRIDRALDYIRAHCSRSSLALADVSEFVRLSRWHLSRLFTRHLGMGFRDVVRRLRMQKATILLNEHVLTVKEIAAELGFPHPTEFDRQFKQTFGVTPTAWRGRPTSEAIAPRL
jgi:AraC-like DNA-binding protein